MTDKITLSLFQRIALYFRGRVKIGTKLLDGWTAPVDIYVWRCPIHGLIKRHTKGYDERLECPHCWEEMK